MAYSCIMKVTGKCVNAGMLARRWYDRDTVTMCEHYLLPDNGLVVVAFSGTVPQPGAWF